MINSVVVIICDLHLVNLVKYRETQVEWTEQRRRSRSRWETRRRRGCKSRIQTKIHFWGCDFYFFLSVGFLSIGLFIWLCQVAPDILRQAGGGWIASGRCEDCHYLPNKAGKLVARYRWKPQSSPTGYIGLSSLYQTARSMVSSLPPCWRAQLTCASPGDVSQEINLRAPLHMLA